MDSGNSGSLQSSSGGDEEYDSRAAAIAADHSIFINTHPPPPQLFDPFSNYTQHHHPNPNNFNNPNTTWLGPTSLRSDLNPNHHHHSITNPFMPSFQPLPSPPVGADNNSSNNPGGGGVSTAARNPRKRSRASRRAPTTVLATDTTNFRAMVQEFTGIPAPPFSNPPFPRPNSLDCLFGSRAAAAAAAFDVAPPQYLRRSFAAQRAQTPPFLVSSSTNNNIISSVSSSTTPINYHQLPFSHNQNPLFGSLLQTNPPKFIFSDSPVMASKPHNQGSFEIPSNDIKTGPGVDEFGLGGHGNHVTATLNDLPNLISSDQAAAHNDREDDTDNENAAKWSRNGYNQAQMKPVNGGYDFSGSTSSNLHGEKAPGNIKTTRVGDQGMAESWIYSSLQIRDDYSLESEME